MPGWQIDRVNKQYEQTDYVWKNMVCLLFFSFQTAPSMVYL